MLRARHNRLRVPAGLGIEIRQHGRSGGTADATEKANTIPVIRNASELKTAAENLAPEVSARIQRTSKTHLPEPGARRIPRIDFRLSADGTPYFIEANPNPEIARAGVRYSRSHDGLDYPTCCIAFWPSESAGKGRRIRKAERQRKTVMHSGGARRKFRRLGVVRK